MLDKIFSRSKKKLQKAIDPGIQFGRYSDNNKTLKKVAKWNEAETLFKEKKFFESIKAFFDYLKDDTTENVLHETDKTGGTFHFYQGSKIIRGFYNEHQFQAETVLAVMPQPSVPVMRRLLEMNFNLFYSRYALCQEKISMLFNSATQTANPSKLYYGLKEQATKADKQDDLLVQDFATLNTIDTAHLIEIPEQEKETKLKYLKQWIRDTLDLIQSTDQDKFSGGIAYLLLALAYRIDYLIVPEGKLLMELEKIVEIYFKKDDRQVTEKNQEMMEVFQKLLLKDNKEFMPYLLRSRYTFSIVNPQNFKAVADAIYNANQNIAWYKENNLITLAAQISEYGFSYCQFSYSLPKPVSEFFLLFMMANYPDYFSELGYKDKMYDTALNAYNKELIIERILQVEERWKNKYPELNFKTEKIRFDNQVSFNQTFTNEIELLNMETR